MLLFAVFFVKIRGPGRSTTRVLIRQGGVTYRFMRFEACGDGSLLALLDRDPRSRRGGYTSDEKGQIVPEAITDDTPLPSAKFSIHTTGTVHRYAGGKWRGTIYTEPLHRLATLAFVGFISIPCVSRLDPFDEAKHRHDTSATLAVDEGYTERITFALEIGPAPQEPTTDGVALHYEIYSVVVRVEQEFPIAGTRKSLHSWHVRKGAIRSSADRQGWRRTRLSSANPGSITHGFSGSRKRSLRGIRARSDGGPPQLTITFNRRNLHIEQIPFDGPHQPTHKVRFWVCDKGGKNKRDDLREHITWIELERLMELATTIASASRCPPSTSSTKPALFSQTVCGWPRSSSARNTVPSRGAPSASGLKFHL